MPTQNAVIESFNGRLRDKLLNGILFIWLAHARGALAIWKYDHNTVPPRSAIRNVTPADYAKLSKRTILEFAAASDRGEAGNGSKLWKMWGY